MKKNQVRRIKRMCVYCAILLSSGLKSSLLFGGVIGLGDVRTNVRIDAAYSLASRSTPESRDPKTHQALLGLALDYFENLQVRVASIYALGAIRNISLQCQVELSQVLADGHWELRYATARAFEKIQPRDPRTHLALAQAMGDTHENVRDAVGKTLTLLRPSDRPALNVVAGLVRSINGSISQDAEKLLQNIFNRKPFQLSGSLLGRTEIAFHDGFVRLKLSDPDLITTLLHIQNRDVIIQEPIVEMGWNGKPATVFYAFSNGDLVAIDFEDSEKFEWLFSFKR